MTDIFDEEISDKKCNEVSLGVVSKSWIFTINNYTEEDVRMVRAVPCQRIIAGFEVAPTTGTPHIQGAIVFKKATRCKGVCAMLGGRARCKQMAGKWCDQSYCAKDGEIVRMEDNTSQGKRVDLEGFRTAIKRNAGDIELLDKHLTEVAKYPRLMHFARAAYSKERGREFRKVEVHVLWGEGGSNKSRQAMYTEDGVRKTDSYVVPKTENLKWFMDYQGESTIIINDFYGGCKWSRFLDLLDGHQMCVEVKGAHVYAEWTTVIITSNKHPDGWYREYDTSHKEMARRLTTITRLGDAAYWPESGEPCPKRARVQTDPFGAP